MLAGMILIPPQPLSPQGVRVKDLAIVIETRQTAGVQSKSLYVVLLRLSKEKLSFGPEEHRSLEETEER